MKFREQLKKVIPLLILVDKNSKPSSFETTTAVDNRNFDPGTHHQPIVSLV